MERLESDRQSALLGVNASVYTTYDHNCSSFNIDQFFGLFLSLISSLHLSVATDISHYFSQTRRSEHEQQKRVNTNTYVVFVSLMGCLRKGKQISYSTFLSV